MTASNDCWSATLRYAQMYGLQPEQLKPGMTQHEIFEMRIAHGSHGREIPEEYAREMLSMAAEDTPTTRLQVSMTAVS